MDDNTVNELSELFLALSDKTRLRLLGLMADGEVSVGFLADSLGESQPKISRHLAYLRTAGLVSTRRDGKWIYYGIEVPSDPVVGNAMLAALGSRSGSVEVPTMPSPTVYDDTFAETDMNDWRPQEMEIYLL
jgi:DNA-binding transcriptional ArsR family regulator